MEKLFDWFLENRPQLIKEYDGKHVVIHDFKVIKGFDNPFDAAEFARSEFEPETFIVQHVSDDPSSYSIQISSIQLVS